MGLSVEERLKTSVGSCGHTIAKGDKYLCVWGNYYHHTTKVSKCAKCGIEFMRDVLNHETKQLQALYDEVNKSGHWKN